jgi:hypothetical protein
MIARTATSLDRLRDAVRARVERTSLRHVARQVGMSPMGLRSFVEGGVPYQKSRRRLFEWLHRDAADAREDAAAEVPEALASLVADLPAERREGALAALVQTLRALYDSHAQAAPGWLGALGEGNAAPPNDSGGGEGTDAPGGVVSPPREA